MQGFLDQKTKELDNDILNAQKFEMSAGNSILTES